MADDGPDNDVPPWFEKDYDDDDDDEFAEDLEKKTVRKVFQHLAAVKISKAQTMSD